MVKNFSLLFIILSIICLLICLIYILHVLNKRRQQNLTEHLSFLVDIPNNLPQIKYGDNIYVDHAFHILHMDHKDVNRIYIIYADSREETSQKFIIFMNSFFWDNIGTIKVLIANDTTHLMFSKIFSLMPSFQEQFKVDEIKIEMINDEDQDTLVKNVNKRERILFPYFLNEMENEKIDMIKKMDVLIFDYVTAVQSEDKFRYIFPLANLRTIHMVLIFPEKKELNYIYKYLTFDKLIYVLKENIGENKNFNKKNLDLLQQYYLNLSPQPKNDIALLNFYEKNGYSIHIQNMKEIKVFPNIYDARFIEKYEDSYNDIKRKGKLEEENIMLEVNRDLPLKIEAIVKPFNLKIFSFQGDFVDGVQIKYGDELVLKKQSFDIENDKYKIVSVRKPNRFSPTPHVKTIIQNGLLLSWNENFMFMKNISRDQSEFVIKVSFDHPDIMEAQKTLIKKNIPVFLKNPFFMTGYIIDIENDVFYVKMKDFEKISNVDQMYECYGYPKIKTKEACESPNSFEMMMEQKQFSKEKRSDEDYITNVIEKRKKDLKAVVEEQEIKEEEEEEEDTFNSNKIKTGVWDRRCITDIECPFFEKNGQDRKSTRLNSSHITRSRMPSSA